MDKVQLDNTARFLSGDGNRGGRPPGTPNKVPAYLKQCILLAANDVGEDGHGRGELRGYLKRLAIHHPSVFGSLLKRILPVTIKADASLAVEVLSTIRGDHAPLNGHMIEHQPSMRSTMSPELASRLATLTVSDKAELARVLEELQSRGVANDLDESRPARAAG